MDNQFPVEKFISTLVEISSSAQVRAGGTKIYDNNALYKAASGYAESNPAEDLPMWQYIGRLHAVAESFVRALDNPSVEILVILGENLAAANHPSSAFIRHLKNK